MMLVSKAMVTALLVILLLMSVHSLNILNITNGEGEKMCSGSRGHILVESWTTRDSSHPLAESIIATWSPPEREWELLPLKYDIVENGCLRINNATEEDEGLYLCETVYTDLSVTISSFQVRIFVQTPSIVEVKSEASDVFVQPLTDVFSTAEYPPGVAHSENPTLLIEILSGMLVLVTVCGLLIAVQRRLSHLQSKRVNGKVKTQSPSPQSKQLADHDENHGEKTNMV